MILAGMRAAGERAASSAIARARSTRRLPRRGAGDVVLIAGKGHEDYQIVGSERRAVQRPRAPCATRAEVRA